MTKKVINNRAGITPMSPAQESLYPRALTRKAARHEDWELYGRRPVVGGSKSKVDSY